MVLRASENNKPLHFFQFALYSEELHSSTSWNTRNLSWPWHQEIKPNYSLPDTSLTALGYVWTKCMGRKYPVATSKMVTAQYNTRRAMLHCFHFCYVYLDLRRFVFPTTLFIGVYGIMQNQKAVSAYFTWLCRAEYIRHRWWAIINFKTSSRIFKGPFQIKYNLYFQTRMHLNCRKHWPSM